MPYAVSKDGLKIHYEIVGKGKEKSQDIPIFFIMGLGMDMRGWMFQVPHFSEKYRVFLVDNRGIGKSDVPDDFFTTDDMADDIYEIMRREGIEKAHFVGASMGGMILQKFASKYPDNVEKLVLACTLAKLDEHEKEIMRQGLKFIKDIEVDKIDEDFVRKYIDTLFDTDPEKILRFISKNIFSPSFSQENLDFIFHFFRDYIRDGFKVKGFIKQVYALLKHDSSEELPKIKAETLIITGDKDRMVPPRKSYFLAQHMPNSILKVIPEGSHAFMFEMHECFNAEVDSFLSDK